MNDHESPSRRSTVGTPSRGGVGALMRYMTINLEKYTLGLYFLVQRFPKLHTKAQVFFIDRLLQQRASNKKVRPQGGIVRGASLAWQYSLASL